LDRTLPADASSLGTDISLFDLLRYLAISLYTRAIGGFGDFFSSRFRRLHALFLGDGWGGSVGSKGCWRGLLPCWWWMGGSSPIQGVGFMEFLAMEGVERGMDGGKITPLGVLERQYLTGNSCGYSDHGFL